MFQLDFQLASEEGIILWNPLVAFNEKIQPKELQTLIY
jgi:hypothetical protein